MYMRVRRTFVRPHFSSLWQGFRMSHISTRSLLVAAMVLLSASNARAQALREIGRTAAGNPVLVEPRTVRRDQALVHANVRVRFAKAVRAPGGDWWSSRTRLTLDCTSRRVKVLENWYYGDTTWRRIASHHVSGEPAFGTVMGGSMTSVAYDVLCPVTAAPKR